MGKIDSGISSGVNAPHKATPKPPQGKSDLMFENLADYYASRNAFNNMPEKTALFKATNAALATTILYKARLARTLEAMEQGFNLALDALALRLNFSIVEDVPEESAEAAPAEPLDAVGV